MKLSGETKLFLGIIVGTVILIAGAMIFFGQQAAKPPIAKTDLVPVDAPTKGNASASAFLVEFSDLQCPACKAFEPTVAAVTKQYADKLLFVYRHFPLSQHPYAQKAAIAAEAAKKQGKFWEMHDELFANQENLSDDTVKQAAQKLGLNMDQFMKDLADPQLANRVDKDQQAGNVFGVNATPTFFLNGKQLNLSSGADLQQAVADAVK